ncbi:BLUF domain-containing protein [uncultured Sphingomonas sp.]|uniref:BLUF domain-containing protein n=1 Tax=uncultured Sphingomonas sp. TaxID=158754 RepID=UPI0025E063BC|nr:BLUF domain-containing protein [uncultured Sphingomonas sp.]
MSDMVFRRVIYRSMACNGAGYRDLPDILAQSRVNNGLDGLSGLLWTDGDRYVQLIEGPPESVAITLARILADSRHEDIRFVSDGMAADRAFGDWSMANLPGDQTDSVAERMTVMLAGAPAEVREIFAGLV